MRQTNFTSQICNPRTKLFREAELARQNKFRQAAAATKIALADPTTRDTGRRIRLQRLEATFKSTEGLWDVEEGIQSTKILRDGVIIIIKGDKMYNILGQTLK